VSVLLAAGGGLLGGVVVVGGLGIAPVNVESSSVVLDTVGLVKSSSPHAVVASNPTPSSRARVRLIGAKVSVKRGGLERGEVFVMGIGRSGWGIATQW
jgi:hypothetical protein